MANRPQPPRPKAGASIDLGRQITGEKFGVAGSAPGAAAAGTGIDLDDNARALLLRLARGGKMFPLEAQEFRRSGEADTVVVEVVDGTDWGTLANSQFQVPGDQEGMVTFFQGMSNNADATIAGSSFGIFVDDVPALGYEALSIFQAGGVQAVQEECRIYLKAEQTVSVRFNHALANPHHVGFIIKGAFWPMGATVRA